MRRFAFTVLVPIAIFAPIWFVLVVFMALPTTVAFFGGMVIGVACQLASQVAYELWFVKE